MRLNLRKPLCFIDLETTGLDLIKDRIVEISIFKVEPDSSTSTKTLRVNPQVPISAEASLVHGIYEQDVAHLPPFKEVAVSLKNFIASSDLAGFNSNRFDIPLLMEEFLRAGVPFTLEKRNLIDVQVIFHKMEQRTLEAAYKFYCNKVLEGAHSAEDDARATFEVLMAQIDRYAPSCKEPSSTKSISRSGITNDMAHLHAFSKHKELPDLVGKILINKDGAEVFNFGKYKGQVVEEVFKKDKHYYNWIMQGEFTLYTKQVFTKIYIRDRTKNLFSANH